MSINWADKYVPAIVEAWFLGEKGGTAVAEVLFGDYNPAGKLPVTFPKTVGQIPYNFPYKPRSQGPGPARVSGYLYPFGHGLSFTQFKYEDLIIIPKQQRQGGNITVSVNVTNIGDRAGDEIVQLYINDIVSSVTTYVQELKGFKRISLEPGEKQTVSFTLTPDELSLWNRHMERVVEPGDFEVMVGRSSVDIRLKDTFEIIAKD